MYKQGNKGYILAATNGDEFCVVNTKTRKKKGKKSCQHQHYINLIRQEIKLRTLSTNVYQIKRTTPPKINNRISMLKSTTSWKYKSLSGTQGRNYT